MKSETIDKPLFISVYAIAKDEERLVRRWYNCFKEADEVCVLVNNSTDKTAQILRSLGVKVVEKSYSSFRFDVARNDAMKLCSSKADLLFSSDIDDVIEPGWRDKIERAWRLGIATGKNPNCILFTYTVVWNQGKGGTNGRQDMSRHTIHTPKGWYWNGRVHEHLENNEVKNFLYYPKFKMESHGEMKDHGLYLKLLEEEAAEGRNDEGRCLHLLGREYMQYQRYDEAISTLQKHLALKSAVWNCERAASMKFIAWCYAQKGDEMRQELWLLKSMIEDPNDRDAPFELGIMLIKQKEYRLAKRILEKCLDIKKPQLDFPAFVLEAWTELPKVCLAESCYYCGERDRAVKLLDEALGENPDNELAKTMKAEIVNIIAKYPKPLKVPIARKRIELPELA